MGQPDEKTTEPIKKSIDDAISSTQFGIWELLTVKKAPLDLQRWRDELFVGISDFHRLTADIYRLSPGMLILFTLSKIWSGVESALLMHLSSRLLRIIEIGVVRGKADSHAICMAIIARLACVVIVALIQWWCDNALPGFRGRVIFHYETYLMRARLRMDLPTSQEPASKSKASSSDGWHAFESIIQFFADLLTSASQLTLIVHASRSSGGPIFALLCIAKPLLHAFFNRSVWSEACVINANDVNYNRMQALESLAGDHYKQDYISGNLGDHILKEYEKASEKLGNTCTDEAWEQLERRPSPYFDVISEVLGDLPMVYCAINAILNPSKFSITSVAVLQQSSITLRYSIHHITYTARSFRRQFSKLKQLYAVSEVQNKLHDGELSYPKADAKNKDGMALELCNVTFSYPGSKKKTNALENVSMSIKPGQLVVIVGANGSGKSTIVKLLCRLYDPTSGTILVDGTPAQQYRAVELRQATATFTQDHNIFPLSLYENISLGYPEHSSDASMVAKAAEQGGASKFIEKLTDGLRTILDPSNNYYSINVPSDPEHPLQKKLEELQKKIDISGGERQRVVASRTFMHLNSGRVKFVAVDEPSSALDPEGEFQLFDRLITGRAGKTMVFVTHRFGHLTKHADLIICMKDGAVAQSGTHVELMRVGGEYEKLYKIQADAFSSGSDPYKVMQDV